MSVRCHILVFHTWKYMAWKENMEGAAPQLLRHLNINKVESVIICSSFQQRQMEVSPSYFNIT